MGIDYAYHLIAERRSADRLVRAVAEHIVPEDRRRVITALSSGADQMMDQVERDDLERRLFEHGGKALCLRFLFPPDDLLDAYTRGEGSSLPSVGGRVQIGCVWTSVRLGTRFVLIEAVAATSDMSRLFEHSPGIRATFAAAARSAGALLAVFDDEQDDFTAVWPHAGRFALSKERWVFEDEDFELRTDEYCEALVTSARREFGNALPDGGA